MTNIHIKSLIAVTFPAHTPTKILSQIPEMVFD